MSKRDSQHRDLLRYARRHMTQLEIQAGISPFDSAFWKEHREKKRKKRALFGKQKKKKETLVIPRDTKEDMDLRFEHVKQNWFDKLILKIKTMFKFV